MMVNAHSESLHSLLFEEGRKLENVKFFPGDDRGLSATKLCEAADAALRAAFDGGLIDEPPRSGREKTTI